MNLDIRWPIGLLFAVFGMLIFTYGVLGDPQPSVGLNVDVIWGAVLGAFGAVMLRLARNAVARQ